MQNHRIPLNALPAEGKEFLVDDPAVWQAPLAEFHMDCRVTVPLRARVHVLPVDNGWLVRGRLSGEVALPCARCAEDAVTRLDAGFEEFAALPGGDREDMGEGNIILDAAGPLLDLAALCWEEFVLALPVTPLCRADCKGLCPRCGANRNLGGCACADEEGDPRLAALRGLVVRNN